MTKGLTALLGMSLLTTTAIAEGDRSGFLLAGGLSLTGADFEIERNDEIKTKNLFGLAGSIKLGGTIAQKASVYFQTDLSLWPNTDGLYVSGFYGLGGAYYFKPSPSPYVEGAVGITAFTLGGSEDDDTVSIGDTVRLGLGYEFNPNFQVSLMYDNTEAEDILFGEDSTSNYKAVYLNLEFKK